MLSEKDTPTGPVQSCNTMGVEVGDAARRRGLVLLEAPAWNPYDNVVNTNTKLPIGQ